MNKIGVDFRDLEAQGVVSPVLEVSCTYKSMVRFEDNVVVVPKICKYNGVRMELSYDVFDEDTGELRSSGTSSHCFLDKSGKPVSLKKAYPVFDQAFRTAMETGI
jgi:acyl-CoA thioester hydrolase